MHLMGAFFADHAAERNGLLDVTGAFWQEVTLPIQSCFCVVLCETGPDDYGRQFTLHADALSPSGRSLASAVIAKFVLPGPAVYAVFPVQLPVEDVAGRYVYTIRLEDRGRRDAKHGRPNEDESVVLPLEVRLPPR